MSLLIARKIIPGQTNSIVPGQSVRQLRRGQFWDVVGEFEIVGEHGGRTVTIQHTLYDEYETYEACADFVDELQLLKGENGVARYTSEGDGDPVKANYPDCTVEAVEFMPFENGQTIIKDYGGMLDGGYFCRLTFTLHQLTY